MVAQRWRQRDAEQARADAEAIEMRVEAEDDAVGCAHRLEEAIREGEAAVERRKQRLVGRALNAV